MLRGLGVAGIVASTGLLLAPALAADYHFEKVATIELPGGKGHGDIATFDPLAQLLYLSMPNDGLMVVDTKSNSVVKYIQQVVSPNGSDWDPDHVYVAAADGLGPGNTPPVGKINDIIVISKEKWKEVGRIQIQGTSPDWLAVDRAAHLIYVDSDDNNQMEVYSTGDHPELKAVWKLYPDEAKTGPDVAALVPSRKEIFQSDDSFVEVVNTSDGSIARKVDTGITLSFMNDTTAEVYYTQSLHDALPLHGTVASSVELVVMALSTRSGDTSQ